MADLLAVWGPHKRWQTKSNVVKWSFTAARADRSFARYVLMYRIHERVFIAKGIPGKAPRKEQLYFKEHFDFKGPALTGRVTDHLKAKLPDEDLALCVSLSMKARHQ